MRSSLTLALGFGSVLRVLLVISVLGTAVGACGGSSSSSLPSKDKTFTKMRGPNTGGLEGDDVAGTCTADEKDKAACYGNVLLQCSDDGAVHAVDCTKPKLGLTQMTCVEDNTTADCK